MNTGKHKLALEICGYKCKNKSEHCHINCKTYWCLVKMEQWKNEQIAQEKQLWIDKAVDFISKRFYIGINNHVISKEEYYTLTELIRDIEQAMKGK